MTKVYPEFNVSSSQTDVFDDAKTVVQKAVKAVSSVADFSTIQAKGELKWKGELSDQYNGLTQQFSGMKKDIGSSGTELQEFYTKLQDSDTAIAAEQMNKLVNLQKSFEQKVANFNLMRAQMTAAKNLMDDVSKVSDSAKISNMSVGGVLDQMSKNFENSNLSTESDTSQKDMYSVKRGLAFEYMGANKTTWIERNITRYFSSEVKAKVEARKYFDSIRSDKYTQEKFNQEIKPTSPPIALNASLLDGVSQLLVKKNEEAQLENRFSKNPALKDKYNNMSVFARQVHDMFLERYDSGSAIASGRVTLNPSLLSQAVTKIAGVASSAAGAFAPVVSGGAAVVTSAYEAQRSGSYTNVRAAFDRDISEEVSKTLAIYVANKYQDSISKLDDPNKIARKVAHLVSDNMNDIVAGTKKVLLDKNISPNDPSFSKEFSKAFAEQSLEFVQKPQSALSKGSVVDSLSNQKQISEILSNPVALNEKSQNHLSIDNLQAIDFKPKNANLDVDRMLLSLKHQSPLESKTRDGDWSRKLKRKNMASMLQKITTDDLQQQGFDTKTLGDRWKSKVTSDHVEKLVADLKNESPKFNLNAQVAIRNSARDHLGEGMVEPIKGLDIVLEGIKIDSNGAFKRKKMNGILKQLVGESSEAKGITTEGNWQEKVTQEHVLKMIDAYKGLDPKFSDIKIDVQKVIDEKQQVQSFVESVKLADNAVVPPSTPSSKLRTTGRSMGG